MKTFTYKGTQGGEIIINDHNDIINDIYFHEYYSNKTYYCTPLLKINNFKYIDPDNCIKQYYTVCNTDNTTSGIIKTQGLGGYSFNFNPFIISYLDQQPFKQNLNKACAGFTSHVDFNYQLYNSSNDDTTTYSSYHVIDIYGGDFNGKINILNNKNSVDFQLFGVVTPTSQLNDINQPKIVIHGYGYFNNDDIITQVIMTNNNILRDTKHKLYNNNDFLYDEKIDSQKLISNIGFFNNQSLKEELYSELIYNRVIISDLFDYNDETIKNLNIEIYTICNTKVTIINPYYLTDDNKLRLNTIQLKLLNNNDGNLYFDGRITPITNNNDFALRRISETISEDIEDVTAVLQEQVFSDDFLNKYDIRKQDPNNYGWINDIIDNNKNNISIFSHSLIMFTDIDNVSIETFIKNIEQDTSLKIYTDSFLTTIIDECLVKPSSFKNLIDKLYDINNSDYKTINNYTKSAFTNLNTFATTKIYNNTHEINIDKNSDLYTVTYFYIVYNDASRFISICPETTDNAFPGGHLARSHKRIRNKFDNITRIKNYYQFVNITNIKLRYFINYFLIFQSNVDYMVLHTHGCSNINRKEEAIYLGNNNGGEFLSDKFFSNVIRHISKNVIIISFICFGAGLVYRGFNGLDTKIPINSRNVFGINFYRNNVIYFYADTASSPGLSNTKFNLESKLLCTALRSNNTFKTIINDHNNMLKNVYDKLNTILLRFYYNIVEFIKRRPLFISNWSQYEKEIELNIIPQDLIETYGDLLRADFNIFSSLYTTNEQLKLFDPKKSLIQFIRFIFTIFSCKKNIISNIDDTILQHMYDCWHIWNIKKSMSSSMVDFWNTLLRNFIYYYFGRAIADRHINTLIEYIYSICYEINDVHDAFIRDNNINKIHQNEVLYFISDYRGAIYQIKDQDFLNKTYENIIYG